MSVFQINDLSVTLTFSNKQLHDLINLHLPLRQRFGRTVHGSMFLGILHGISNLCRRQVPIAVPELVKVVQRTFHTGIVWDDSRWHVYDGMITGLGNVGVASPTAMILLL
jgi:hypothetical protein